MILVTGANGFVGHRLTADLRAQEQIIRTVGRTTRSADIVIDAIDGRTDWREALKGIDRIVHLAARVHMMKDSASDPLEAFRTVNRDGTLHLAREAAAAGVRRFVFISTLKVNGETRQDGNTAEMTWDVGFLVRFVDERSTFECGDVMFTGSPAGTAQGTGLFLKPGDVVEAEVDGIGILRNTVGPKLAR